MRRSTLTENDTVEPTRDYAATGSETLVLEVKPRNSLVPYVLDVFDPSQPAGCARVVARHHVPSGETWRTRGAGINVSMAAIRAAVAAYLHTSTDTNGGSQ
jgi:hypothetical protein